MCVYNGAPIVNFDRAEVRRLSIYGNEPFSTDNESAMRIYGGGFVDVAIETLEDGYMRIDSLNAVSLRLPNFKTLRGGFLILYCNYLQSLMLPALKSVVGGTVVSNAGALAELSLPALVNVYCTQEFNILWNCDKISELSLPNVTKFSTTGARTVIKIIRERSNHHVTVDLPMCEIFFASFASGTTESTLCELHFGVAINTIYTLCNNKQMLKIKIGKGAVTSVSSVSEIVSNWDTDSLKQFISDLGDNTDGLPKQIKIGASQIAKLSEEDIALAVAKNYSLS